jgi:hypothetical protein
MQAPAEESSLAYRVIMWQAAAVEGAHEKNVCVGRKDSHENQQADCQSAAGLQPAPHLNLQVCLENVKAPDPVRSKGTALRKS